MKILFAPIHYIFDEYKYGSEFSASFNLADKISKKNLDIVVVTGKKFTLDEKKYRIIEINKDITGFISSAFSALSFNLRVAFESYKILRNERFDIIHHVRPFSLESTFNLILLLGLNKKVPVIIGSFTSAYKNLEVGVRISLLDRILIKFFLPIVKKLSILTLKKADMVIVYDAFTKSQVLKYVAESKISIIPPGKDKTKFKFKERNQIIARPELICVGHLINRKGCDFLVNAMSEVVSKLPSVHLKFIGDGIERIKLERQVKDLGLDENITFIGTVNNSEIQNYYYQSNIFVSMQREESFGQVFVEAMACGLPIITTETIGSKNIVENKGFGYIVPQGDTKKFAELVVGLINDKEKLRNMSQAARNVFEERYDWDTVIIPQYLEVYEKVLNSNK